MRRVINKALFASIVGCLMLLGCAAPPLKKVDTGLSIVDSESELETVKVSIRSLLGGGVRLKEVYTNLSDDRRHELQSWSHEHGFKLTINDIRNRPEHHRNAVILVVVRKVDEVQFRVLLQQKELKTEGFDYVCLFEIVSPISGASSTGAYCLKKSDSGWSVVAKFTKHDLFLGLS